MRSLCKQFCGSEILSLSCINYAECGVCRQPATLILSYISFMFNLRIILHRDVDWSRLFLSVFAGCQLADSTWLRLMLVPIKLCIHQIILSLDLVNPEHSQTQLIVLWPDSIQFLHHWVLLECHLKNNLDTKTMRQHSSALRMIFSYFCFLISLELRNFESLGKQ